MESMQIMGVAAAGAIMGFIQWRTRNFGAETRASEWDLNEECATLSRQQLHWTIVHIRDELSSLFLKKDITNLLLAMILAAILLK